MKQTVSKSKQAKRRLLKGQLSSLVLYGTISTTVAKARFLKPRAESLISKIQTSKDSLELLRFLKKELYGGAVKKAFDYKGRYKSVSVYKLAGRYGDGAPTALVTLNENVKKIEEKEVKPVKKTDKIEKK
jgi:ribosomal protein L17